MLKKSTSTKRKDMRNTLLRSLACLALIALIVPAYAQTATATELRELGKNPDLLVSKWQTGTMIYDLRKDGTSMVTISGRECPGTWSLTGTKVTITPKKWHWKQVDPCSQPHALDIINVNAQGMDISEPGTEKQIHLVKIQ